VFPAYPASTEGGKKVSARCTRRTMAHRVGAAGYSSTLRTTMSTRPTHRECSKNYKASLRWRNHSLRLILSLTVLLLVGVMAVLVLEATNHPGGSSAVHATGEGGTFSSSSSISQLPRTGGP
jgi:hypothetical protein